jgi:hypothetical protein
VQQPDHFFFMNTPPTLLSNDAKRKPANNKYHHIPFSVHFPVVTVFLPALLCGTLSMSYSYLLHCNPVVTAEKAIGQSCG